MQEKLFLPAQTSLCMPSLLWFDDTDGSKVWDTYTGETLQTFSHGHIVRSADISASQSLVATGGAEKLVRVYDLEHDKTPLEIGSHNGTIKSVVWDRSCTGEKTIVTSGDDKTIIWWDGRSPKASATFTADEMITSMEQSIDRKNLVVTAGRSVLVFNAST